MSELFIARCRDAKALAHLSESVRCEIDESAPWLKTVEIRLGKTLIVAAVNPCTPLGVAKSPRGASVVLGYGLEDLPNDTAAQFVRAHDQEGPGAGVRLCREINFGVAVSVLETGSLILTTDYLGLFPMYLYEEPGSAICSSALRLVRHVPGFAMKVDAEGVVGGLLLSHNLFGRTIWQNVRRLEARQVLLLGEGGQVAFHECARPAPPVDAPRFEEHMQACHATLQEIAKPYVRRGVKNTLMSGGLDSRLIAGYIGGGVVGARPRGFLIGDVTDNDVRCGAKVLEAISFAQERIGVDSACYPEWARQEAYWNGAESGLYCAHFWSLVKGLASSQTPLFTGLLGDAVMGVSHISWAYDPVYQDYSFERLLGNVTEWGLPQRIIERLLRVPDVQEIARTLRRRLEEEFESYPGDTWRKAWWFDLHHRQRFLIGRVAKLIASSSWPVTPLADYRLLNLMSSLPLSSLRDRRLQTQTVVTFFPKLASLPMDRNNNDTRSVSASLRQRSRVSMLMRDLSYPIIERLGRRLGAPDRRFHARMFDLNAPGWRKLRDAVRQEAPKTADLMDPGEVLRLIPEGSQAVPTITNIWRESTGRKYLMGLILWHAAWASHERRLA